MSLAVPVLLLAQLVSSHRQAAPAPSSAAAERAGGLAWKVPAGWVAAPSASSMRVATYRVDDAEMAVFYFGPGQGGSVESNVERWLAQFQGGKGQTRTLKVGDIPVTMVSTTGTYASGMPGASTTPRSGYALYGAIAEGPGGTVFFKLTGPQKTVDASKAGFDSLIKSLKKG